MSANCLPSTLSNEIKLFIIAGLIATACDFVIYWILCHFMVFSIAKFFSFLAGSFASYNLNKYFTFKNPTHSRQQIIKFAILYTSTLLANVWVNHESLNFLKTVNEIHVNRQAFVGAFILATAISTVLNFIGQKFWVFKK